MSLAPEVITRSWFKAWGEKETMWAESSLEEPEGGGAIGVMSRRSS